MSDFDRVWSVFTKPWPALPLDKLASLVARMGFNGIEFPLRPGFQVDLGDLKQSFSELVNVMADHGVTIASVASATTPQVFDICAEHQVPLIRIMVNVSEAGYVETGDLIRRELDGLVPLVESTGVQVGIQPHYNAFIADSSELAFLLKDYDASTFVAIWDAAHEGLAGKNPANGLALLRDRLAMANFKNACYERISTEVGPRWRPTFVAGPDGLCSWAEAAGYLNDIQYTGPICMPAEYTDDSNLEEKVSRDLGYLRKLLNGNVS